jgi:hypothetical protein
MIQQTIFPFKIEITREKLTARGGLALMAEYNHGIGLRELTDRYLPEPGSNRGFKPSVFVDTLVLMLQGGACKYIINDTAKLQGNFAIELIGRFKSFIVQEDGYLLAVLRYVEGNPVRAGMVSSAQDWLWSSHKEALGEKSRGLLLDEIPIEKPDEWGRYVDEPLTEKELQGLRESANRQSPFGALIWQSKLCKELGLESTIRHRGRPRNQREK